MRLIQFRVRLAAVLLCSAIQLPGMRAAEAPALPDVREVLSLIRSNLTGVTEAELNRAAVAGLIEQLRPRVSLVTNSASVAATVDSSETNAAIVSLSRSFDNAFGYVRLNRVVSGAGDAFGKAVQELSSTNKLKGLVVDLRFASGHEYAAAAEVADHFFSKKTPLIKWGEGSASATDKEHALKLPVVVLVNDETRGAAEVLAALLREADVGLVIGSQTAGQAHRYQEFVLKDGHRLRIATGSVQLLDGRELSAKGVVPDIPITVNRDDEKAFFEDPYRSSPRLFATATRPATNGVAGTNRPRRRLNEAELVRMQREGIDLDPEVVAANSEHQTRPVVQDPALARGLDLLKGIAMAQGRR